MGERARDKSYSLVLCKIYVKNDAGNRKIFRKKSGLPNQRGRPEAVYYMVTWLDRKLAAV